MRQAFKRAQASVSRSNVLTVTLSVILGAIAVYGFANQVVVERDAAISRAVQEERSQRDQVLREFREDLADVKGELKAIRQNIADLRVQTTAIAALQAARGKP